MSPRLQALPGRKFLVCGNHDRRAKGFDVNRLRNSGGLPLGESSILLMSTNWPWSADWMPALEDRRHAEKWR